MHILHHYLRWAEPILSSTLLSSKEKWHEIKSKRGISNRAQWYFQACNRTRCFQLSESAFKTQKSMHVEAWSAKYSNKNYCMNTMMLRNKKKKDPEGESLISRYLRSPIWNLFLLYKATIATVLFIPYVIYIILVYL